MPRKQVCCTGAIALISQCQVSFPCGHGSDLTRVTGSLASHVSNVVHVQVYRACQRGYWRASKRWCKQLPQDAVNKALIRFANNEAGLRPIDIFGGRSGSIAQLQQLEQWFQSQREFFFYSSSVLIIYEGDAETAEEARVTIKLVDFAHTFPSDGRKDTNFVAGITALIDGLTNVLTLDHHDCLL